MSIFCRVATGLQISLAAVRQMTLPEVWALFDYWQYTPPAAETLMILTCAMTTWKPDSRPESEAEMRARQENLWKSGASMNVADMYQAMGGSATGRDMPGIGPFPGA